ncbi:unnamed protein product [Symbiodinium natans]|uniref:Uncharacterized protein n=1 Tax=Symbiodinium natans TaxID=878477 RepID=A0A812JEH0_9DINO|nr:unnamed protein product [Symbiodinium natans]
MAEITAASCEDEEGDSHRSASSRTASPEEVTTTAAASALAPGRAEPVARDARRAQLRVEPVARPLERPAAKVSFRPPERQPVRSSPAAPSTGRPVVAPSVDAAEDAERPLRLRIQSLETRVETMENHIKRLEAKLSRELEDCRKTQAAQAAQASQASQEEVWDEMSARLRLEVATQAARLASKTEEQLASADRQLTEILSKAHALLQQTAAQVEEQCMSRLSRRSSQLLQEMKGLQGAFISEQRRPAPSRVVPEEVPVSPRYPGLWPTDWQGHPAQPSDTPRAPSQVFQSDARYWEGPQVPPIMTSGRAIHTPRAEVTLLEPIGRSSRPGQEPLTSSAGW